MDGCMLRTLCGSGIPPPEAMLFVLPVHLFDVDTLRLHDEEFNEDCHEDVKDGKEEEGAPLQCAKHGEEQLRREKDRKEVGEDRYCGRGGSGLL